MFMGAQGLAMHFHEIHPEDIDVPKCHLSLMVREYFVTELFFRKW